MGSSKTGQGQNGALCSSALREGEQGEEEKMKKGKQNGLAGGNVSFDDENISISTAASLAFTLQ